MASKGRNPKKGGDQKREKLLIAAIDFGSTYSGYAFSFKDDFQINPLKIYTNNWSAEQSGGISYKAPTTVLLKPDQTFHSFGYDAEDKYATLTEADEHEGWYYFSRFKMKLMNALDISRDQSGSDRLFTELKRDMEIDDIDGKKMSFMTIIAHAIRYLKEHLLKQLKEKNVLDAITVDGIFWVITVPAIWTDSAKQFTREAATEAGIHDDQLMLAYEPEAAALYCRLLPIDKFESGGEHKELVLQTFERGKTFMVLDLGGGTVDIAVQQTTQDGKMKTIHRVCGGPWGGTKVDESFLGFLNDLFGPKVVYTLKEECRSEYLEFLRGFEMKKRTIENESNRKVTLKIPAAFTDIVLEKTGTAIQDQIQTLRYNTAVSFAGDKLIIEHAFFESFFKKSVADIISHLQNVLNDECCHSLAGIVIVGGFAESAIVNSAMKNAFPDQRFIIPMEAGLAVCKGAVLFGHDPDVIFSRICRYTYGESICKPFDEAIHSLSKFTTIEGLPYCKQIFRKFFTEGQVVMLDTGIEMESEWSFVDEWRKQERFKPITLHVYISDKKCPMYVDDEGCRMLGVVKVNCDNGNWPERVYVTTRMEIAGTEIKVTATMHTGEKVSATFNFL
ncbi:heat shock 70 kDa protein 12A-like isoform X2 [Ostrea edulis]|uniref:heat shock 70 kDa protein 12A-like isoform X2 n=1 Tax=Ostrea edulis TaxID=37623 RepID=UPI0020958FAD|nr:heat shock 70 kDa protein 12A-like isoform X2 [Ostrea edulis]XP_056019634.1 heat shock 70 kDa protein 12A-like isoform X2 [Ostrea edulis]